MSDLKLNNGQIFSFYKNTNNTYDIWVNNPNDVLNNLRDLTQEELNKIINKLECHNKVCSFKNYATFTYAVLMDNENNKTQDQLKVYAKRIKNGELIKDIEKEALKEINYIAENLTYNGQKISNSDILGLRILNQLLQNIIGQIDIYDVLEPEIKELELNP